MPMFNVPRVMAYRACGASRGGCRKKDRSTFHEVIVFSDQFLWKHFEAENSRKSYWKTIGFAREIQRKCKGISLQSFCTKRYPESWPVHKKLIGLFFCNPLAMLHKTAEGFGVIPSELRVLFAQFASISVPFCHDRVQAFLERIISFYVAQTSGVKRFLSFSHNKYHNI